jgi:Fur family transcriptional regulator, peroxide stress response regulator
VSRKSIHRETILRVVMNTTSHPGADWIYNQVRNEIPNISMGTVYHNLKLLAEAGNIKEIEIPGSFSRFDGAVQDHYHFRCEKCGCLFDLDQSVDHTMEAIIAEKTGFKVKRHILEFIGLCLDCQKTDKK